MVTAKFIVDFKSFNEAVHTAELKLKDFEDEAHKVGPALNRMVDNFSGRKLIHEGQMMARVLGDAGSIARLTGSELQVAGAKAAESAEKMRRLGMDVPPGLQRIADAVNNGKSAFASFGHQVLTTAAGFVTAQAIIGGVTGVVKALGNELKTLTLHGSDVASVGDNFQILSANAGHLGAALLGTLRAGTRGTITDFELMKTVNQDLAAGMNLTTQQFGTLAKGAHALAQATGGDVKTALDTMNDAMVTGKSKSLALLTGKIDLEAAEKKFAASLGTTSAHLSEEGKLEAARAGILAAVGASTARLGDQTDGLKDRVEQARVAWTNFEDQLGRAIATSSTLKTGMVELQAALVAGFGGSQEALIRAIVEQINLAAVALIGLAQTGVQTSGFLVKEFYAVQKVFGNLAQIIDGNVLAFKLFSKVAAAATFDTKGLERIDAELAMIETRMSERGKSLKAADAAQAGVDASTGRYVKTLAELQAKMEEARSTSAAFVGPLREVAAGHDAAGAAAGRHGLLTKQSNEEISKAKAALEALRKALLEQAGALVPLTSVQQTVVAEQLKLGLSAEQIATILNSKLAPGFKITASAVSLFADVLKDLPERMDAFRKAGVDAATAVGKSFAGQTHVLQEMAQTMGDLVLPSKQFAATGQLIGTVYADTGQVIARAMTTGEAGLLKLTAAQKAQVSQLRELGVTAEDIAKQMGISFRQAGGQAQTFGASLSDLASSLTQLAQVSGDSFGGLVQDIAKAVVGLNGLVNAMEAYSTATSTAAKSSAAFSVALLGIGYAYSVYQAGVAHTKSIIASLDSYLMVVEHFQSIAAEAERMGISLDAAFNAKSANDFRAAVGAIDAQMASMMDAVHGMGAFTKEELQAVADQAKAVFDYMEATGKYSAEQLATAWEDYTRKLGIALGEIDPAAALGEIPKAAGEAAAAVDALAARYKTLSDRVAKEAPERHMGSIEKAARAEMKALEAQMAAQNSRVKADAKQAADALEKELAGIDPPAVHVKVVWDIPNLPSGRVSMPKTSSPTAGTGAAGGGGTAVINLDGRTVAEVIVPLIPGVVKRYGLR